jgi:hypothetical protein
MRRIRPEDAARALQDAMNDQISDPGPASDARVSKWAAALRHHIREGTGRSASERELELEVLMAIQSPKVQWKSPVFVYTSDTSAGEALVQALLDLAEVCNAEESLELKPIYGSLRQWFGVRFRKDAAKARFDDLTEIGLRRAELKAIENVRTDIAVRESEVIERVASALEATDFAAVLTEKILFVKTPDCLVVKPITNRERGFLMENHDLLSKPAALLETMQLAPTLTPALDQAEGDGR